MKKFLLKVLESVVGFPPAIVRSVRNLGATCVVAANAFTPSIHRQTITKFSASVIATRYLVGKISGATGVAVAGLGDRAHFVIKDTTASATDLSLANPAAVACIILDCTEETVPMIAAGALNVGDIVYPVAAGQVNTYVGLGSSGTNYPCGMVVANPAAQAGDVVEVMPIFSIASATV